MLRPFASRLRRYWHTVARRHIEAFSCTSSPSYSSQAQISDPAQTNARVCHNHQRNREVQAYVSVTHRVALSSFCPPFTSCRSSSASATNLPTVAFFMVLLLMTLEFQYLPVPLGRPDSSKFKHSGTSRKILKPIIKRKVYNTKQMTRK